MPQLPPQDPSRQPPAGMQELRIIPVPGHLGTKEEPDPSRVLVVSYDKFMAIVNELAGSGAANMRRFSQKLTDSVMHEAAGQFADRVQQAYIQGGLDETAMTYRLPPSTDINTDDLGDAD